MKRTSGRFKIGPATDTLVSTSRQISLRLACWLLAFASLLLPACGRQSAGSKSHTAPPASVKKLPQETEIALITLTAQAEQRLGITLAPATREQVERRRTFGGEMMIPGGKSIIVSAPVAGTVAPPAGNAIPLPGERIDAHAPVLSLAPLLTPERDVPTPVERIQMANARATLLSAATIAKGDVDRSQAELNGATIALNRATQLLADKAGSAKAVDDAQALLNIATSQLNAAMARQRQFEKLLSDLDAGSGTGTASPLMIVAPQTGVIRTLAVSRGQTVSAGAALFEVVDTSTMWIRTPLYVDLLAEIDRQAVAQLVPLGRRDVAPGEKLLASSPAASQPALAYPVIAPPSADPLNVTADLYYQVANVGHRFRPGQRVGISLKLTGAEESLVVPAKSVLYDIYGGAWVYVKSSEHAYERARVLIRYTANGLAVLDAGPAAGTPVVVDGAAELFGTEFGAGK